MKKYYYISTIDKRFDKLSDLMAYLCAEPESVYDVHQGEEIIKCDKCRTLSGYVDYTKYYPYGARISRTKIGRSELREKQANKYKYLKRFDVSPYYYLQFDDGGGK